MAADLEVKKQLYKALLPDLICSYCAFPPKSGVRQNFKVCSLKAHILCDGFLCRTQKNNECPTCAKSKNVSSLSKVPVSCLTKLIENNPFSACMNYSSGCTEIMELSKIGEHESICEFRTVMCNNGKCGSFIDFRNFIDHLETRHSMKEEIEFDRVFELDLKKDVSETFYPTLLLQRGTDNRFIVCIYHDDINVFLYTSYYGPSYKAKHFSCYFKIVDGASEISYKGPVFSLGLLGNVYDFIPSHKCFVITKNCYKSFMKEGEESLNCIVEIKDLKEDAKHENDDSGLSSEEQS